MGCMTSPLQQPYPMLDQHPLLSVVRGLPFLSWSRRSTSWGTPCGTSSPRVSRASSIDSCPPSTKSPITCQAGCPEIRRIGVVFPTTPSPDISPSRLLNRQMSLSSNRLISYFENPAGYKLRWPRPRRAGPGHRRSRRRRLWGTFARVRAHGRFTIRRGYASAHEHTHAGKILRDHRGP